MLTGRRFVALRLQNMGIECFSRSMRSIHVSLTLNKMPYLFGCQIAQRRLSPKKCRDPSVTPSVQIGAGLLDSIGFYTGSMETQAKQQPKTSRSGVGKEIIWACVCCALFFAIGGLIGFITGGDDHFRGGRLEFSNSEWANIRREQWGSFWLTGLLSIPLGLGFYGVLFLVRALWWRFTHDD